MCDIRYFAHTTHINGLFSVNSSLRHLSFVFNTQPNALLLRPSSSVNTSFFIMCDLGRTSLRARSQTCATWFAKHDDTLNDK